MLTIIKRACTAVFLLICSGCMSGPLLENPVRIPPQTVEGDTANPVYLPGSGSDGYRIVFESTLDVVDDYFEIKRLERYSGIIVTFPKTAPGIGRPLTPGSPDIQERILATLQSIRYRCNVHIQAAKDGGYFVDVEVLKELEDIGGPTGPRPNPAALRSDPTVERQLEVVDDTVLSPNWIPLGRERALEQEILAKITELRAACDQQDKITSFFSGMFSGFAGE